MEIWERNYDISIDADVSRRCGLDMSRADLGNTVKWNRIPSMKLEMKLACTYDHPCIQINWHCGSWTTFFFPTSTHDYSKLTPITHLHICTRENPPNVHVCPVRAAKHEP